MDGAKTTKNRARDLRRAMTPPEAMVRQGLRRRQIEGFHFRRQHPLGPYVLDFYCHRARLAVEIDGYFATLRIPASEVFRSLEACLDSIQNAVADRG
jgi:very-short-patch-repair endonuclease